MPSNARYSSAAFVIDNKGYISCGNEGSAFGPFTKEQWQYDPLTDVWAKKKSFPGPARYGGTGFAIDGKGYAGLGGKKRSDGSYLYYTDVYEYDSSTNSWTQKADYPERRNFAVSFVLNGLGYVGVGQKQAITSPKIYSYNPSNDVWTLATGFPGGGRFIATVVALNGKAYVGLGANLTNLGSFYNDWWEFTPALRQSVETQSSNADCEISFSFENNQLLPHFNDATNEDRDFILYDVSGSVVQKEIIHDASPIRLNASLSKGIYFAVVRLKDGSTGCTQKIVIQ